AAEATRFYGAISARGGGHGGNGGSAEVSGIDSLIAQGSVNLTAPRGRTGTVLYDPLDIQILGGNGDGDDTEVGNDPAVLQQNGGAAGKIFFANEGAGTPVPFIVRESEIEAATAN